MYNGPQHEEAVMIISQLSQGLPLIAAVDLEYLYDG
jgi:hypothetical protein